MADNSVSCEDDGRGLVAVANYKIFNDPVHGSIRLHPLLVDIIDTSQFQRLRDVKQLGASYWVYPGASHNRFEHCIGTAYLCGSLLRTLKEDHDQLISRTDIICAEIAGLCHDLGHGPFSHVFDHTYIKLMQPELTWTHEQGSADMFDHMLNVNKNLQRSFEKYGIWGKEIQLVKDLILGKDPVKENIPQKCIFQGREYEKWFLYEVVSNKRNGIDCDKFDYLMRDSHYIGTNSNFDFMRYVQNIRILPVDNQMQICVRDKEVFNLYQLFHTRWSLHHRVYQHKTTKIIEQMIVEAMAKVDRVFNISDSIHDMASYTHLSDSIIYEIMRSRDKSVEVKQAKKILTMIQERNLYKFCGQVSALCKTEDSTFPSSQEVLGKGSLGIAEEISSLDEDLCADDVFVSLIEISFGMKQHDPINSVVFFSKEGNPMKIRREEISELLPHSFLDSYIRVYSRDPEKNQLVENCFADWCEENGFKRPCKLEGDTTGYFTDAHKDSAVKKAMQNQRLHSIKTNLHVKRSINYNM